MSKYAKGGQERQQRTCLDELIHAVCVQVSNPPLRLVRPLVERFVHLPLRLHYRILQRAHVGIQHGSAHPCTVLVHDPCAPKRPSEALHIEHEIVLPVQRGLHAVQPIRVALVIERETPSDSHGLRRELVRRGLLALFVAGRCVVARGLCGGLDDATKESAGSVGRERGWDETVRSGNVVVLLVERVCDYLARGHELAYGQIQRAGDELGRARGRQDASAGDVQSGHFGVELLPWDLARDVEPGRRRALEP